MKAQVVIKFLPIKMKQNNCYNYVMMAKFMILLLIVFLNMNFWVKLRQNTLIILNKILGSK